MFFRRFKGGALEPHPNECSIIVNYKLEAAVYGCKDMSADPMLADKKVFITRIMGVENFQSQGHYYYIKILNVFVF
jgi:hypothetical protein